MEAENNEDWIVYFISAECGGPIKIGKSICPETRMADLQVANPNKLHLLATCRRIESILHVLFDNGRIRGEWFRPSERLLRFILALPDVTLAGRKVARLQLDRIEAAVNDSTRCKSVEIIEKCFAGDEWIAICDYFRDMHCKPKFTCVTDGAAI